MFLREKIGLLTNSVPLGLAFPVATDRFGEEVQTCAEVCIEGDPSILKAIDKTLDSMPVFQHGIGGSVFIVETEARRFSIDLLDDVQHHFAYVASAASILEDKLIEIGVDHDDTSGSPNAGSVPDSSWRG
ncbi:MAG: hypothetical protein ACLQMF_11665 [Rectinemataceae bacterium]